jgi:hypothetical protein
MSQRDLVAELQAARLTAPPELRERVRLIAAADASARRPRLTWRRALVVALPVAAAVAATVVLTRPAHRQSEVAIDNAQHGSVLQTQLAPAPRRSAGTASKAFGVPTTPSRVQVYGATLSLRIPNANGVSDAVKRAMQITTSLGGYSTSVHASSFGKEADAELTLKVPRDHVQEAITRLAQLGTITAEQVDVLDKQASLNATDRQIARLQKQLAAARAEVPQTDTTKTRIAQLTASIARLQRGEAATRRTAHYATIHLSLTTAQQVVPPKHHHHGPLHGVVVALTWLGIGAVYALAIGLPVLIVLLLLWLAIRTARRRREDALLSRS